MYVGKPLIDTLCAVRNTDRILAHTLTAMDNTPSDVKNSGTFTMSMPSDTEVIVTRFFDAPREKLWKVLNDPSLIPEWWGPREAHTQVDKMEVHVGGKWQYTIIGPSGKKEIFRGKYMEIVPMEKIAWTFEYEPYAGHISTQTVTLEDWGDKSFLMMRAIYANKDDREGMVGANMESGMRETYDRLEELLMRV